jgi:hypothetical protein
MVFRIARFLARLMIMSAQDARGPEDEDQADLEVRAPEALISPDRRR